MCSAQYGRPTSRGAPQNRYGAHTPNGHRQEVDFSSKIVSRWPGRGGLAEGLLRTAKVRRWSGGTLVTVGIGLGVALMRPLR